MRKIKHEFIDEKSPFKENCRIISFTILINTGKYGFWRYYLLSKNDKFSKLRSLVRAKHKLIKEYLSD